ncbi:hypothetical protein [Amycolatopsis sp. lyj-23]|uniref:hypothetical protein n=1 Tax=Amycolatopsis sp. lyj-23 TaxID=2789283 RepID=UPI00397BC4FD
MSLTTQLDGRDLADWCAGAFPGTPAVVDQVVAAARAAGRPVRPTGHVEPSHWADIGGAFGQRLADLVDPAPPYGALLGMIRAGWLTWDVAHEQAAAYPTHRDLDAEHRARALSLRRTPDGWLDLGPARDHLEPDPAAAAALAELLERTRAYQAAHAPVGTLGSPGAEAGLARSAWVIAACEGIHRSGRIAPDLSNVMARGGPAGALRAIASDQAVSELVELAGRLQTHRVLDELHRLAGHPAPGDPLGVAAPTFVPGWADGDLLVGTSETTTLLDVKTVISLSNPDRIARWCWQILLYAWLDTGDLHHIRAVGLYLARHGALVTWDLDTYAGLLLDDPSPDLRHRARESFRGVATDVIRAEGAHFPIA